MAIMPQGSKFVKAIIESAGLDPKIVKSFVITAKADDAIKIEFNCYFNADELVGEVVKKYVVCEKEEEKDNGQS